MRGFDTLWQPGYDHAGISTQNVVEKQLAKEGTSRKELGREAFVERVWRHLEETGRTIMGQFRSLGASLDYSRERFTMDDAYVEAVMRFFVHLWDRGWIYRAERIVNWCPFHETAISDLEVEHVDMDDTLTYARYPFADGSGTSRSRRCGRRRSWPTSPSRCTPTTSATATRSARRCSFRTSSGRCRWSRMPASSPSSAPARSRSRPATTRPTSRSAATTASRSSP